MKRLAFAFVVVVAACGKGKAQDSPTAAAGPPAAAEVVSLLVSGIGDAGLVQLRGAALVLTADGQPLPGQLGTDAISVGVDPNGSQIAKFTLPPATQKVAIALQFQPDGTVVRNGVTQPLDLQGPPIAVIADAAQMRTRNKVLIQLDLSRSLIDQGGQVFLLPDFMVQY